MPTVISSPVLPSQEPTLRRPQGSRTGASVGPGTFVTHQTLRLTLEYLWFLFISAEGKKKQETSEAISCLPEFKEWLHFRDNMGLRNSSRKAED